MRALVFGVQPESVPEPPPGNPLLEALARTPMRLMDVDEPTLPRADWVLIKPRLTGICGSDSKQVFMDWGSGNVDTDNPMIDFASFPQVLGHEVVADVVEVGAEAEGLSVGDRVVLNPWLSCAPRGISPLCPACEVGDLSLCWHFTDGPLAPGIHIGTSKDLPGGYANLMTAHHSMLFKVPDSMPDEIAVFADPFAVSLHSITRHPPARDGRALVYGAGALGSCAVAILRSLYPDVEVGVVARFDSQRRLAEKLGASRVFQHEPAKQLIEEIAEWSGGVLRGENRERVAPLLERERVGEHRCDVDAAAAREVEVVLDAVLALAVDLFEPERVRAAPRQLLEVQRRPLPRDGAVDAGLHERAARLQDARRHFEALPARDVVVDHVDAARIRHRHVVVAAQDTTRPLGDLLDELLRRLVAEHA